MTPNAERIRKLYEEARTRPANAEIELVGLEDGCARSGSGHVWAKAVDTSYTKPGYRSEGDAPGTMGIDWRGPSYNQPERVNQWERECEVCGKKQTTTRTEEVLQKTYKPKW